MMNSTDLLLHGLLIIPSHTCACALPEKLIAGKEEFGVGDGIEPLPHSRACTHDDFLRRAISSQGSKIRRVISTDAPRIVFDSQSQVGELAS